MFRGRRILATGFNDPYTTHPWGAGPFRSAHAEARALRRAWALVGDVGLRMCGLLVVRVDARGAWRYSRPCAGCWSLIRNLGLRVVGWSTNIGLLEVTKQLSWSRWKMSGHITRALTNLRVQEIEHKRIFTICKQLADIIATSVIYSDKNFVVLFIGTSIHVLEHSDLEKVCDLLASESHEYCTETTTPDTYIRKAIKRVGAIYTVGTRFNGRCKNVHEAVKYMRSTFPSFDEKAFRNVITAYYKEVRRESA